MKTPPNKDRQLASVSSSSTHTTPIIRTCNEGSTTNLPNQPFNHPFNHPSPTNTHQIQNPKDSTSFESLQRALSLGRLPLVDSDLFLAIMSDSNESLSNLYFRKNLHNYNDSADNKQNSSSAKISCENDFDSTNYLDKSDPDDGVIYF